MREELTVEEQLEKYRQIEDWDEYFRNLKMKDITLSDMLIYQALQMDKDGKEEVNDLEVQRTD